jgi:hypothetical protein
MMRAVYVLIAFAAVLPGEFVRAQELPPETALPEVTPTVPSFETPRSDPLPRGPGSLGMDALGMGDFGSRGQGGMGLGGLGMAAQSLGGVGYGATWYPSRPVSGSVPGANLGLVAQNLYTSTPICKDGDDSLRFTAGVRNSTFTTDAILPDSHRVIPSELWNVSFGLDFLHKFDNGWTAAFGLTYGSASDKPFYGIKEMNVGFNAILQVPVSNERDWWRFSLMYSPVGNVNFPIPGVAYVWNPSNDLHVCIGLPLSVMWRPVEDLTIYAMYVPLTNVNGRVTYRLADKVFIFGGYQWAQEAYLLADRAEQNDRFLGYEQRLIGGIRWDVWQHAALEINSGYAFNRYYGIGQNQIRNLTDRVDIAPGVFVGANFRVRF